MASAAPVDDFAAARDRMVRDDIAAGGVTDLRVLESMRATPRHEFLPASQRPFAYFDMALPIGESQTISGPFVVASMTASLEPKPGDRVLEIGTGSGYQAAVLAPLVKTVYSIEIKEPLAVKAARTLKRLGYTNVITRTGDGFQGWPEHAPFDGIIVTCSPEDVPQPLLDQKYAHADLIARGPRSSTGTS
jgi:protein-L-isoaspartate(D-aspartate) O-methyltransferase